MTSEVYTRIGRYEIAPHGCFACGELNAHGLRLRLHAANEMCWTEVTLPEDFQGWQGIIHGGILATILDEVMGWSLGSADAWGFTARLTIEYKRPAHVGRLIRGEGVLVQRRRRVLNTTGRVIDLESGEVIATAEAVYVAAPAEEQAALKERYQFRLIPEDGA